MKRSVRRKVVQSATAASLIIAAVAVGGRFYFSSSRYGIPYCTKFTANADDHWTALGGVWEVVDGSMRNDSNDRGAKLLTGSPNWKDYVVEGDVQLLGIGSVGLLARVRDAELGENSQKAYFAGVRTDDGLVLGAYDFAYHEIAKVPLPEPVRPFRWYHLGLSVDGCTIRASVAAAGMHEIKTAAVSDPDCFRSGSIGLRSNGTGGVWRNVTVVPAGVPPAATGSASLPDASPLGAHCCKSAHPWREALRPCRPIGDLATEPRSDSTTGGVHSRIGGSDQAYCVRAGFDGQRG